MLPVAIAFIKTTYELELGRSQNMDCGQEKSCERSFFSVTVHSRVSS